MVGNATTSSGSRQTDQLAPGCAAAPLGSVPAVLPAP